MGHEDTCDTGLSLRLGYGGRGLPASGGHRKKDPGTKLVDPRMLKTLLVLGPLTDVVHRSILTKSDVSMAIEEPRMDRESSPQNTVSSFLRVYGPSVKEKDLGIEEVEVEKVSSRIYDEDEDGSARKKLRLTKEQSALLEDRFKEHSTLNPKQKQALAKHLNLRPRQVEVWFQNRRARTKLKQTQVDREFLKKCCVNLTDENRRLQEELRELKALKISPAAAPPYMQLQATAATLTVCPSCERIGRAAEARSKAAGGDAGSLGMAPKRHFLKPFLPSSPAAC